MNLHVLPEVWSFMLDSQVPCYAYLIVHVVWVPPCSIVLYTVSLQPLQEEGESPTTARSTWIWGTQCDSCTGQLPLAFHKGALKFTFGFPEATWYVGGMQEIVFMSQAIFGFMSSQLHNLKGPARPQGPSTNQQEHYQCQKHDSSDGSLQKSAK